MNTLVRYCVIFLVFALTGCATSTKNPQDPMEDYNRTIFNFNDKVDQVALKPVATVYKKAVPEFMQTGVGNFFGNIGDVSTALNNFLQARPGDGASDVGRVLLNTTVGLAGLFDVATPTGLPKHDQDFGQTLGRWGVKSGPYVVLPFLGPSTMRDTVALPVDLETDLWGYKYPVRWRNTGTAIRLIDRRAYILDTSSLLEDAALDRYEFVRDAYLQRRESKIYHGKDADGDNSQPPGAPSLMDSRPTSPPPADQPKDDSPKTDENKPN
ncbi:MAG TPA: VacJ family lipoprotein [Burkholderiaceae bacterium]